MVLLCGINISINFAGKNDINPPTQQGHSREKDLHSNEKVVTHENIKDGYMKCSYTAEKLAEMLITIRNVIAKNQQLINTDPITPTYTFKGFIPAIVGSEVANDFSLRTGYRIKQTSLKVRNPNNEPDEWEEKILKLFDLGNYKKNVGYGEIIRKKGKKIYRYMKPIYVDTACLQCHGTKDQIQLVHTQTPNTPTTYPKSLFDNMGDTGLEPVTPLLVEQENKGIFNYFPKFLI